MKEYFSVTYYDDVGKEYTQNFEIERKKEAFLFFYEKLGNFEALYEDVSKNISLKPSLIKYTKCNNDPKVLKENIWCEDLHDYFREA